MAVLAILEVEEAGQKNESHGVLVAHTVRKRVAGWLCSMLEAVRSMSRVSGWRIVGMECSGAEADLHPASVC